MTVHGRTITRACDPNWTRFQVLGFGPIVGHGFHLTPSIKNYLQSTRMQSGLSDVKTSLDELIQAISTAKKGKDLEPHFQPVSDAFKLLKSHDITKENIEDLATLLRAPLVPLYAALPQPALTLSAAFLFYVFQKKFIVAKENGDDDACKLWEAVQICLLSGVHDFLEENPTASNREHVGLEFYPSLCNIYFTRPDDNPVGGALTKTVCQLLSETITSHPENQRRLRNPAVLGAKTLGVNLAAMRDLLSLEAMLELCAKLVPPAKTNDSQKKRTQFISEIFHPSLFKSSKVLVEHMESLSLKDWDKISTDILHSLARGDIAFPQPFDICRLTMEGLDPFQVERIYVDQEGLLANVDQDGCWETFYVPYSTFENVTISKSNSEVILTIDLTSAPALGPVPMICKGRPRIFVHLVKKDLKHFKQSIESRKTAEESVPLIFENVQGVTPSTQEKVMNIQQVWNSASQGKNGRRSVHSTSPLLERDNVKKSTPPSIPPAKQQEVNKPPSSQRDTLQRDLFGGDGDDISDFSDVEAPKYAPEKIKPQKTKASLVGQEARRKSKNRGDSGKHRSTIPAQEPLETREPISPKPQDDQSLPKGGKLSAVPTARRRLVTRPRIVPSSRSPSPMARKRKQSPIDLTQDGYSEDGSNERKRPRANGATEQEPKLRPQENEVAGVDPPKASDKYRADEVATISSTNKPNLLGDAKVQGLSRGGQSLNRKPKAFIQSPEPTPRSEFHFLGDIRHQPQTEDAPKQANPTTESSSNLQNASKPWWRAKLEEMKLPNEAPERSLLSDKRQLKPSPGGFLPQKKVLIDLTSDDSPKTRTRAPRKQLLDEIPPAAHQTRYGDTTLTRPAGVRSPEIWKRYPSIVPPVSYNGGRLYDTTLIMPSPPPARKESPAQKFAFDTRYHRTDLGTYVGHAQDTNSRIMHVLQGITEAIAGKIQDRFDNVSKEVHAARVNLLRDAYTALSDMRGESLEHYNHLIELTGSYESHWKEIITTAEEFQETEETLCKFLDGLLLSHGRQTLSKTFPTSLFGPVPDALHAHLE
ncbi:hypothetical protein BDN72DRAFT_312085 [Pluteus cervinus]|uniref:Uncharacterized protein n=1 Tax=Pluteus cervinus TaxID=181527 RepID=A0ACD3B3C3_9AGAR|nr:hypothetical protein BDN72DRAFT_312085 [Pluteus cervinus]